MALHRDHRDQQLPYLRLDARADDARIEQVLELVDDDEEDERVTAANTEFPRLTSTMTVFEIRLPMTGSSDATKVTAIIVFTSGRWIPRPAAAPRVDAREGRVDQRDPELREHDLVEGVGEAVRAHGQVGRERPGDAYVRDLAQREHRADHERDQRLREQQQRARAHGLQLRDVAAQPFEELVLDLHGVVGQEIGEVGGICVRTPSRITVIFLSRLPRLPASLRKKPISPSTAPTMPAITATENSATTMSLPRRVER
jgi:hypothetical protein